MIFPFMLVVALTLPSGEVVTAKLAEAASMEHCQALGDTYVALGHFLPKTLVTDAELSCVAKEDEAAEEPTPPTKYKAQGQKVPGSAM